MEEERSDGTLKDPVTLMDLLYFTKPGTDAWNELAKELECQVDIFNEADRYCYKLHKQADDFFNHLCQTAKEIKNAARVVAKVCYATQENGGVELRRTLLNFLNGKSYNEEVR
jgi:hypothetical protein